MRTFSKLFMTGLIALGMISCNKENSSINGNDSQERLYFKFNLEVPTTRSSTENDGTSDATNDTEEGTAVESKISTIELVLTGKDHKVIAVSDPIVPNKIQDGMFYAAFKSEDIYNAADKDVETPINVLAYCNTTSGLNVSKVEGQPTTISGEVTAVKEVISDMDNASIWTNDKFAMTNANNADMINTLPSQAELVKHVKIEDAINLGTIKVERTAARFDIANKTTYSDELGQPGNKYNVEIAEVGLFNLAKECYKLRRVSDNGVDAEDLVANWTGLFGKETKTNYVVDPTQSYGNTDFYYWDNPDWTSMTTINGNAIDHWEGSDAAARPEYHVYRYATENTLAASTLKNQAYATGVAFKTYLTVNAVDPEISAAFAAKDDLYVYNKVMYGNWARVEKLANGTEDIVANEELKAAVAKVAWFEGQLRPDESGERYTHDQALEAAGFKVFKAENKTVAEDPVGKYPMYYNYYNRHNNNNDATKTGPMEYAVVRNNVYKLMVKSFKDFGDPTWKRPQPDIPLEEGEVYFEVTVSVLPWSVRINDIEF